MLKNIFLAFIPIFVAVDAIGVLPIFVALTSGVKKKEKSRIILNSLFTALGLAIGFIFLGKAIFSLLGISIGDFMVAGGLILLCFAVIDLVNPVKRRRIPLGELGAVPLGTPLIVGPAVLTTSLMIVPVYGLSATLISIVINVLLAGVIFSFSQVLLKLLGESGAKALSKVFALLLAAIAVMMVRKGITVFITG